MFRNRSAAAAIGLFVERIMAAENALLLGVERTLLAPQNAANTCRISPKRSQNRRKTLPKTALPSLKTA
jgi:hypothetical protein